MANAFELAVLQAAAGEALLFFDRYRLEDGEFAHLSRTCLIVFAQDVVAQRRARALHEQAAELRARGELESADRQSAEAREAEARTAVALKFMADEEALRREVEPRRGALRDCGDHVLGYRRVHVGARAADGAA